MPVKFFHSRIDRGLGRLFFDWPPRLRLRARRNLWRRRFRRPAPKHVGLESLERRRVGLVIELVRIRPDKLPHPILEKRFLFELGQLRFLASLPLRSRLRLLA